jgi:hypothetical protein
VRLHLIPHTRWESFVQHFVEKKKKFRPAVAFLTMPPLVGTLTPAMVINEKRAHLIDLKRERLIDQVCTQEILPPEK